jgi:hypothetical protein
MVFLLHAGSRATKPVVCRARVSHPRRIPEREAAERVTKSGVRRHTVLGAGSDTFNELRAAPVRRSVTGTIPSIRTFKLRCLHASINRRISHAKRITSFTCFVASFSSMTFAESVSCAQQTFRTNAPPRSHVVEIT